MAHIQKITGTKSQIYGLVMIHNDRAKEDPNGQRERDNENIDPERTHLNYDLLNRPNPYKYAMERLDKIEKEQKERTGKGFRSDAVKACSLIVYLPKEKEAKGEKYEREFFKGTLDYAINKFGKENILQAVVHKDENRPHIHIVALPITRDKEGHEKLCYKEAFSRKDYNRLHPELEKTCRARTGDRTISLYEDKDQKAQSVDKETYILRQKEEELKQAKEDYEKALKECEKAKKEYEQSKKDYSKDLQTIREAKETAEKIRTAGTEKNISTPEPAGKGFHKGYYTKDQVESLVDDYNKSQGKIRALQRGEISRGYYDSLEQRLEQANKEIEQRNLQNKANAYDRLVKNGVDKPLRVAGLLREQSPKEYDRLEQMVEREDHQRQRGHER